MCCSCDKCRSNQIFTKNRLQSCRFLCHMTPTAGGGLLSLSDLEVSAPSPVGTFHSFRARCHSFKGLCHSLRGSNHSSKGLCHSVNSLGSQSCTSDLLSHELNPGFYLFVSVCFIWGWCLLRVGLKSRFSKNSVLDFKVIYYTHKRRVCSKTWWQQSGHFVGGDRELML